ncbi:MAG TPA: PepSY-associated TM helix domain-containing protein [Candidatus Angelobacter sp.]
MRKLIFNVHLYLALLAAVFIMILGVTGSIMAFEPEIDHLLHPRLSYVKPAGPALSLAELGAVVSKRFPDDRIEAYSLSTSPNLSYQIALEKSGTVYINQYSSEVLGVRPDEMDFLAYVHQLHLRLLWQKEGDPGKKIISWVGVAMLFLLLSGLYLWWPAKRVAIKKGSTGRRFWFDLHNMIGVFSLAFLLLLTLTGMVIGFERTTTPLLYRLTGSQPSRQPTNFPAPPPDARPITPDQALEIARTSLPGATPFLIIVPAPKGAYQIRLRYPEDRTPGGRSRMIVDQYTGKVLFAEGSRSAPAGTRMVIANRALHTGDIFGIPSKMILSLASLMLVAQAISGIMMWWKRRKVVGNLSRDTATAGSK